MRVAAIVIALQLTGCATIFTLGKNEYPVRFDSQPPGAALVVREATGAELYRGDAPTTITLSTRSGSLKPKTYFVEAELDGYEKATQTVRPHINGWYWGNIAIGGAIGMLLVDPQTGAMWRFDEKHVIEMDPAAGPRAEPLPSPAHDECLDTCAQRTGMQDSCRQECRMR